MVGLIHGLDSARIRANLERVWETAGPDVEILAATKYVPTEELGALSEAGVSLVGENRMQDLAAKHAKLTFRPFDFKEDLFRDSQFYVACDSSDDLPYILQFGTEDRLMVGTDYTHADQSAELDALDIIERKAASEEIPSEVARKILDDNPRRFYGL